MKFLILLTLLSPAAQAAEPHFQPSPFSGVCQDVALLGNKDYLDNKPYWDDVIPRCGPNVQILPETGFFATMRSRLGEETDQEDSVKFLQRVADRKIENIDFNNKVTELWARCASGDTAWIDKKRDDAKKESRRQSGSRQVRARFLRLFPM